jgi:hypothetical protein
MPMFATLFVAVPTLESLELQVAICTQYSTDIQMHVTWRCGSTGPRVLLQYFYRKVFCGLHIFKVYITWQ